MVKNNSIVTLLMASLLCLGLLVTENALARSGSYSSKKSQKLASGDKSAAYYCGKADVSQSPEKEANLLLCANALLKNNKVSDAKKILAQIKNVPFEGGLLTFKNLVNARLALAVGNNQQALTLLKRISPNTMSLPVAIEYNDLLARTYQEGGNYLQSVITRIKLDSILADKDMVEANNEQIWSTLQQMSPQSIRSALNNQPDYILSGWLELAQIERKMDTQALSSWNNQYRNHPGAALLPQHISPTSLSSFHANHIALLLPLTGNHSSSAQAIRDGFIASLALAHNNGAMAPRVEVIDTLEDRNISGAYNEAIQNGADLIIGPLTKQGVEDISKISSKNVPILALNRTDRARSGNIFQFGLAPEDEARQAADKAWQDGHVTALVITENTRWGNRVTEAFLERWENLGGQVVSVTEYSRDRPLSSRIKSALRIDSSESRAKQLSSSLSAPLEYDARRRQDIDMVFMAAHPTEARQIPPLLAFYFAQNVPVYGTSSIYSGQLNPGADKDLNGVTFCDIPWNIDMRPTDIQHTQPISVLWPDPSEKDARLYALGVDAYQLISVLPRLEAIPQFSFNGATGKLSLNNENQVVRTLRCTQFKNGEPKRLSPNV